MLTSELNFILTIDGQDNEFSFPDGARFRYFTNGGDGNYSIVNAYRFIEFRTPLENAINFIEKIDYNKKIDKLTLINKFNRKEVLTLGTEEDPLGYPAISIMNDDTLRMEEVMTIPFEKDSINNNLEGKSE